MSRNMVKWAYADHKSRAKKRGLSFTLTFDQWYGIWLNSGKLDMRGRGADKYCMSRYNDQGGYDLGNVFIQSNADNVKEAKAGKTQSLEHRARRAESLRGKPSGSAGKTAWNKGVKGSTKPKHITNIKEILS